MIEFTNVRCKYCNSENVVEINVTNITKFHMVDKPTVRHFFMCKDCKRKNCIDEVYESGKLTIEL